MECRSSPYYCCVALDSPRMSLGIMISVMHAHCCDVLHSSRLAAESTKTNDLVKFNADEYSISGALMRSLLATFSS